MTVSDAPTPGYRRCVGLMLASDSGLVFTARRLDTPDDAWQMPQGGIDAGETPRQAAMRELHEETGTDKASIVAESRHWLSYDLPEELRSRLWGGRFVGQTQKWFLLRFTGTDADFALDGAEPEFSEWRWSAPDELTRLIVPFKREVYARVVAEFQSAIADI